jgi:glycosyltransferase involved in cell wall biosynthesis
VNTLSIVTPSYRPNQDHLTAAYESILSQETPTGWTWEWVIQEDGTTGEAAGMLPSDSRVKFGVGRRGGVALTRNLAVARSTGSLLKNLDSDDVLGDGVLARDIAVLSSDPTIGWTTSRVLDLLPDGSTVGFPDDPPEGRLEPGTVADFWRNHGYRLPVHPTTICIRRGLAVALGGWMGVPGSDDTGLLIAVSTIAAGYFHREVGLLYRKWPGQATAAAEHTERTEWQLRMGLIDERANALRAHWVTERVAT